MKPVIDPDAWSQVPGQLEHSDVTFRDERRPVELTAYIIRSDKKIVDVKIFDLSYDGCAIRTLVPLVVGEKVKLTVLGRGAIDAEVRWCNARSAGLLLGSARTSRPRWPRQAERIQVFGHASLRRTGRISYRVATFDLTRFGCMCEFIERPQIYERVWVKFEQLQSVESVVCWIEEARLGLMFKKPLHPAVFDMLLFHLGGRSDALVTTECG